MPDFQGTSKLTLQPTEQAIPFQFTFPICSAADANDGFIPYGDTISDCTVKAYDSDGTDITSEVVESSSIDSNVITVEINYPTTNGADDCKLTFQITTTNGAHLEADFGGSYARSPDRFRAIDL